MPRTFFSKVLFQVLLVMVPMLTVLMVPQSVHAALVISPSGGQIAAVGSDHTVHFYLYEVANPHDSSWQQNKEQYRVLDETISVSMPFPEAGQDCFVAKASSAGDGKVSVTCRSSSPDAVVFNYTLAKYNHSSSYTISFEAETTGCANPPATPVLNSVTKYAQTDISVKWNQANVDQIDTFLVKYGPTPTDLSGAKTITNKAHTTPNGTEYITSVVFTDIPEGSFFQIVSQNSCGTSAGSNVLTVGQTHQGISQPVTAKKTQSYQSPIVVETSPSPSPATPSAEPTPIPDQSEIHESPEPATSANMESSKLWRYGAAALGILALVAGDVGLWWSIRSFRLARSSSSNVEDTLSVTETEPEIPNDRHL